MCRKENLIDYLHIMSVDDDGVESEALHSLLVLLHLVLQRGRVALPQAIHVDDSAQIVQLCRGERETS